MGGRFASRFSEGPLKDGVETLSSTRVRKSFPRCRSSTGFHRRRDRCCNKGRRGESHGQRDAGGRGGRGQLKQDRGEHLIGGREGFVWCLAHRRAATWDGCIAVPVVGTIGQRWRRAKNAWLLWRSCRSSSRGRNARERREDGLARCGRTADKVLVFPNDLLCDEGNMRSLEIPHGWADRPGERLVLGNQMRGLSDRFFIAHERLAQATHLAMEMEDPPTKGGEARDLGPMKWMGMGASTVGERGLWESLARASHWSVIPGGTVGGD
jgi:hypothetical protein